MAYLFRVYGIFVAYSAGLWGAYQRINTTGCCVCTGTILMAVPVQCSLSLECVIYLTVTFLVYTVLSYGKKKASHSSTIDIPRTGIPRRSTSTSTVRRRERTVLPAVFVVVSMFSRQRNDSFCTSRLVCCLIYSALERPYESIFSFGFADCVVIVCCSLVSSLIITNTGHTYTPPQHILYTPTRRIKLSIRYRKIDRWCYSPPAFEANKQNNTTIRRSTTNEGSNEDQQSTSHERSNEDRDRDQDQQGTAHRCTALH